jgi:hypothetical protein
MNPTSREKSNRPLQSHFGKQGKGNLSLGKTQTSAFVSYSKNPHTQFLQCSTVMLSLRHRKNTNYNMEHIIFIFWQSYEIMGKGTDLSLSLKFHLPCVPVKCTLYGFSLFFPLRSETMPPTSLHCLGFREDT